MDRELKCMLSIALAAVVTFAALLAIGLCAIPRPTAQPQHAEAPQ